VVGTTLVLKAQICAYVLGTGPIEHGQGIFQKHICKLQETGIFQKHIW